MGVQFDIQATTSRFDRRSRNKDGSLRKVRSDKGDRKVPVSAEEPRRPRKLNILGESADRVKNGVAIKIEEEKSRLSNAANGFKSIVKNTFPSDKELKEIVEEEKERSTFSKIAKTAKTYSTGAAITLSTGLLLLQSKEKLKSLSDAASKATKGITRKMASRGRLKRIIKKENALDAAESLIKQTKLKENGLNVKLTPKQLAPRATARARRQEVSKVRENKIKKSKKLEAKRNKFAKKLGIEGNVFNEILNKSKTGGPRDRSAQRLIISANKKMQAEGKAKARKKRAWDYVSRNRN